MKKKTEWGKMRIVFLANKDLILKSIKEGYSLKEILRKNPNLNISYDALASYVRKYFKKNLETTATSDLSVKTQSKESTSANPITTQQKSRTFIHDTNKKLEDMI
ncbi:MULTISPECIES: TraK family protein [unclassified Bartonella]|uniref:TraK family protein n=1 Tax=unclassified Bartonella TaxID=2645622 RepID=UPI0035D02B1E